MRKIEVSEETYNRIKDQLTAREELEVAEFGDLICKKWFFRTVTYHLIGRAVAVIGKEDGNVFIQLEDASWVADSGRFMNAIRDGELSEVEPVGDAFVNMDTVTDFFPWRHSLPLEQK